MRLRENRIIKKSMWSIMFDTLLPEESILPAHPWANMDGRRNKKPFYICSEVIDSITDANSGRLGRGLEVVLGEFGVFPRTLTGRIISQKIFPFEVNLPFIYNNKKKIKKKKNNNNNNDNNNNNNNNDNNNTA